MDFLINLYTVLDTQLESAPESYGLFHVACILAVALLTFLVCKLFKDSSDRAVNVLTALVWVVILTLEIYKQLIYGFDLEDGAFVWDYAWYAFPFQFCSTPMYIALLTGLFRRGRVHRSLMAFLATYAIFAGVCILVYPGIVFTGTAGINIQTMICHGSMLSIGIYLYGSGYVKIGRASCRERVFYSV